MRNNFVKGTEEKPEQIPYSNNSRWVRIHYLNGVSCLGYYNYKLCTWNEFKEMQNLANTVIVQEKSIRGWNY